MAVQGSGFINLQRIIGASDSDRLNNTVAGQVAQTGTTAQNALQSGQQAFNTDLSNTQKGIDAGSQAATGIVNKFSDPNYNGEGVGSDQASQYQGFLNQKYTGPQGIANADALKNLATTATQTAGLTASRGGRQQLLQQQAGATPNYTQHNAGLDELILSLGNKGGNNPLQQAADISKNVAKNTNTAINRAGYAAQNTANDLSTQQSGVKNTLNTALTNTNTDIGNAVTNATNLQPIRNAAFADISHYLQQGNYDLAASEGVNRGVLTQDQANFLRQMGTPNIQNSMNAAAVQNLGTPVDPNSIYGLFNQGAVSNARGDVASDVDRGRINALNILNGGAAEFTAPANRFAGTTYNTANAGALANNLGMEQKRLQAPLQQSQQNIATEKQALSAAIIHDLLNGYDSGPMGQLAKQDPQAAAQQIISNSPNNYVKNYQLPGSQIPALMQQINAEQAKIDQYNTGTSQLQNNIDALRRISG